MASVSGRSRSVNKNVSTSAVSRAEKVVISQLRVINESNGPKVPGKRSNSSSVWQYYGALHHQTVQTSSSDLQTSSHLAESAVMIDDGRLFCR